MKKIIIFSLIITTFILVPVTVLAQNNANINKVINTNEATNLNTSSDLVDQLKTEIEDELSDPGVLPDSPFYFVKSWSEGIQSFFTFNTEKKAELQYKFAMRRVAEVNKLVAKGKTDKIVDYMKKYEQHLVKFSERMAKLDSKKTDKTDEMAKKLELLQKRQQDVLADVYNKVPVKAQAEILNAMDNSSKGLEKAIEKIEGQEELESFRERFKTRVENEFKDKNEDVRERMKTRAEEMIEKRLENDKDSLDHDSDSDRDSTKDDIDSDRDSESDSNTNDQEDVKDQLDDNDLDNSNANDQRDDSLDNVENVR